MYGSVSTKTVLSMIAGGDKGKRDRGRTSTYWWPLASFEAASLTSSCVGREDSFFGAGELLLFRRGLLGGFIFGFWDLLPLNCCAAAVLSSLLASSCP
jgi:hypothetical protein